MELRQFFAAPVFEDEDKTRAAGLLNAMLLVTLGLCLATALAMALVAPQAFVSNVNNLVIFGTWIALALALQLLLRRGHVRLASLITISALWAIVTFVLYHFEGIANPMAGAYFLCIVGAGLLLGGQAAFAITLLSLASVWAMWYAGQRGLLPPLAARFPMFDPLSYTAIFLIGGLLLYYAVNSLYHALGRAQRGERAMAESNRQLQDLRASLEQQVASRTQALERRSHYLAASAQVSQAAASTLDVDHLIHQVVELIRERFDLYYVGLLLLDETGQWAVLRAGTGEAGRALLARGLRAQVGPGTMVGWCIVNKQARVLQDVTGDTVRMPLPELPNTRSEAALPLRVRGEVIGALTIEDDEVGTFDQDFVNALQTMVDQVAVAIDNARLFAESQRALEAERRAFGQMSADAWRQLLGARTRWGYTYEHKLLSPLRAGGPSDALPSPSGPTLTLPVKERDQVIGVVSLQKDAADQDWQPEERALAQTVIEQLGVALESARLHQDAQRRAARERLLREISDRMQRAADMESLMQAAAQELNRTLGASRAYVRWGLEALQARSPGGADPQAEGGE